MPNFLRAAMKITAQRRSSNKPRNVEVIVASLGSAPSHGSSSSPRIRYISCSDYCFSLCFFFSGSFRCGASAYGFSCYKFNAPEGTAWSTGWLLKTILMGKSPTGHIPISPGVVKHRIDALLVDRVLADGRHGFAHLQPDTSTSARVCDVAEATICLDQQTKAWGGRDASIDRFECLLGDDRCRCCLDGWISIHFLRNCRHHNYGSAIVSRERKRELDRLPVCGLDMCGMN